MLILIICRLVNPLVVAPTVAAVGLAFFSYGFPQAGSCVEISVPHIVLLLIFTLVGDLLKVKQLITKLNKSQVFSLKNEKKKKRLRSILVCCY